jgi:hypothetical protein
VCEQVRTNLVSQSPRACCCLTRTLLQYVGESALLDGLYRVTARTATYCELCILYR